MGGRNVEVEGLLEPVGGRVHERPGHGPADIVDHQVEAAERLPGPVDQGGHGIEIAQVGGHGHRTPPGALYLRGHLGQLLGGPGRDHHVGTGLGQADGRGRADSPPGPGDHGHLVGQLEAIENHRMVPPLSGRQCYQPGRRRATWAGQAGREDGSPSLRWSHDTVRSTLTLATIRLLSMVSTKGRNSSVYAP